jgi:uncharacterized protein (TIGR02594 family)
VQITAFDIAQRFVGVSEVPGSEHNPQILAMLRLDAKWPEGDEVAWCSAFVNYVAWILRLPRSKSLRARSWLRVGRPLELELARADFDVVILKRGGGPQPPATVIEAPGHVGFFAGLEGDRILVLGGNQGNEVSIDGYPRDRLLGVRRLV